MELQHLCLIILATAPCVTQCGPHFLRERYIRKFGLERAPVTAVCLHQPVGYEAHIIDYMSESDSVSVDIPFSESEVTEESNERVPYVEPKSEGLECCPIEDYDHVLDSLSHDDFYVIDSALLRNYFHPWIDGWVPWVNQHYRLGKRLYILDFAAQAVVDFNCSLDSIPKCFQILRYQPEVSDAVMNSVLKQLKEAFSITRDEPRWKSGVLQVDLLNLAIARFAVDHADRMQFPENDRHPSNAVYMTSPTTSYGGYVSWPNKHKIFEDIVRANGLGSLIQLRILDAQDGGWTDLPFGPPRIPRDWDRTWHQAPDAANLSLPASGPL